MRRLSLHWFMLLIACTPTRPPVPAPPPVQTPSVAHVTPSAAPATAPVIPAPTVTDATRCGLPPRLRARGWPEHLTPLVDARPDTPELGRTTIAVLPDTQYYTLCRYPHFANQVQWLTDNALQLNLKAAIHLGDITDTNVAEEWEFARQAIGPLLGTVPTFLATGNHDHGELGTANRHSTQFTKFFAPLTGPTQNTLVSTAVPGDHENAYYRLPLPNVTLGVLVLGWSPQAATVTWANHVLAQYPNDRVIFVTHAYLYTDSTRYDWVGRGPVQEWNPNAYGSPEPAATAANGADNPSVSQPPRDVYDGERLWESLISQHKGIFLTLNGHVLHGGTGRLTSRGKFGNDVHQVLVNYQMLHEGGSGYLRLLEISPDGKTLRFRTYSPSLKQWAVAPDQHFDLPVKPPLW